MIPYHIETLYRHEPWASWVVLACTVGASLMIQFGGIPAAAVNQSFVLGQGGPEAFLCYLFAHSGIAHLLGNMVFLWVFGNAVCGTVGNLGFLALYFFLGAFVGFVHLLCGGAPLVGSSGAIAGLVGLSVAFFPTNRVNLYYSVLFATRTVSMPLWGAALYWTAWDVIGAWFGLGPTAYWAHLGGAAVGVGIGLVLLSLGVVQLTEFDNASLLDVMLRRMPPHKVRAAQEARAELRRMARAFMHEYSELPAIELSPGGARPRLTLARSMAGARPDSNTAPVQFGTRRTIPLKTATKTAATAGEGRPAAWPPELPDVRYFFFDGAQRQGPVRRGEFLAALSLTADTSRWWYWAEGMKEWRRVASLGYFASPAFVRAKPTVAGR